MTERKAKAKAKATATAKAKAKATARPEDGKDERGVIRWERARCGRIRRAA
jgi:hypothetical protein